MATTDRDYYELLGVPRDADEPTIKKAFRRLARELHPDVSERARRRGALPRGDRGLRGALEQRDARALRPLRARRASLGRLHADATSTSAGSAICSPRSSATTCSAARRGAARSAGGDVGCGDRDRRSSTPRTASRSACRSRSPSPCATCGGDGVEPGTSAGALQPLRRSGRGCSRSRAASSASSFARRRARSAAVPGRSSSIRARTAPARAGAASRATLDVEVPAGIHDGQRIRVSGEGHAGALGGRAGDVYVLVHVEPDPRFVREGNDIFSQVDLTIVQAALGAEVTSRRSTARSSSSCPPGVQPGDVRVLRGKGMPVLQGFGHGDHRVLVNVSVPRRAHRRAAAAARGVRRCERRAHLPPRRGLLRQAEERVPLSALRRVAVEVGHERLEEARATMLELFPDGLRGGRPPTAIELVAYTDAGGEERLWHVFGGARSRPTSRTAGRSAGATFHRPVEVGPLWVGPPWESRRPAIALAVVDRPRPRVRHRRAPDDPALSPAAAGARARLAARRRLRVGRPLDRGRAARVRAGARRRHRGSRRSRRRATNARANGVAVEARLVGADDAAPGGDDRRREHLAARRCVALPDAPATADARHVGLPALGPPEPVRLRARDASAASARRLGGRRVPSATVTRSTIRRDGDVPRRLSRLQGLACRRAGGARGAARATATPRARRRDRRRRRDQHLLRHERGGRQEPQGSGAGGADARAAST